MPMKKAETTATAEEAAAAMVRLLENRHIPAVFHVSASATGFLHASMMANAIRFHQRPTSPQHFDVQISTRQKKYQLLDVEVTENHFAMVQVHNIGSKSSSVCFANNPAVHTDTTCSKYKSLFYDFVAEDDAQGFDAFTFKVNVTFDGVTLDKHRSMEMKHRKRLHEMPSGKRKFTIWQFVNAFYYADRCPKCRTALFFLPLGTLEGKFLDSCILLVNGVAAIQPAALHLLEMEWEPGEPIYFNQPAVFKRTALFQHDATFQKWRQNAPIVEEVEEEEQSNDDDDD